MGPVLFVESGAWNALLSRRLGHHNNSDMDLQATLLQLDSYGQLFHDSAVGCSVRINCYLSPSV